LNFQSRVQQIADNEIIALDKGGYVIDDRESYIVESGAQVLPITWKYIPTSHSKDHSLLLGIFTTAARYHNRMIIRETYLKLKPSSIDIVFVIGKVHENFGNMSEVVDEENDKYGDILVLNCRENVNHGKSFYFFKFVHNMFHGNPYKFVMKGDDDTFFHLFNLAKMVNTMPRSKVYFGTFLKKRKNTHNKMFIHGYGGLGYGFTWDLLGLVANQSSIIGIEDQSIGFSFIPVHEIIQYINLIHYSIDFYHAIDKEQFILGLEPHRNMISAHPLKSPALFLLFAYKCIGSSSLNGLHWKFQSNSNETKLHHYRRKYINYHSFATGGGHNSSSFSVICFLSDAIVYVLLNGTRYRIVNAVGVEQNSNVITLPDSFDVLGVYIESLYRPVISSFEESSVLFSEELILRSRNPHILK